MKQVVPLKPLFGLFAACLVVYAGLFAWDRHLRLKNGPWRVTFAASESGHPAILVNQRRLGVTNLLIVMRGERSPPPAALREVVFDSPLRLAPFGRVIFHDLTFLPGTVTFDFFGHEVELLPRTLIVNKHEVPWGSTRQLELDPAGKVRPPRPEPALPPAVSHRS